MTLKEYAKENAKRLDAKFHENYPNGKFSVQVHSGFNFLHWVNQRNTSQITHIGISNYQKGVPRIVDEYHQGSAFGKVYLYKTLDAAIKKARKLNFSEELIQRFVERYNNREELIKNYDWKEHREYLKSINFGRY